MNYESDTNKTSFFPKRITRLTPYPISKLPVALRCPAAAPAHASAQGDKIFNGQHGVSATSANKKYPNGIAETRVGRFDFLYLDKNQEVLKMICEDIVGRACEAISKIKFPENKNEQTIDKTTKNVDALHKILKNLKADLKNSNMRQCNLSQKSYNIIIEQALKLLTNVNAAIKNLMKSNFCEDQNSLIKMADLWKILGRTYHHLEKLSTPIDQSFENISANLCRIPMYSFSKVDLSLTISSGIRPRQKILEWPSETRPTIVVLNKANKEIASRRDRISFVLKDEYKIGCQAIKETAFSRVQYLKPIDRSEIVKISQFSNSSISDSEASDSSSSDSE